MALVAGVNSFMTDV